jgi:lysine 2,3-aminomutase
MSINSSGVPLEKVAKKFNLPLEQLKEVADIFPFKVTPYYYNLISQKDDPLYKQCIPSIQEISSSGDLVEDPLAEDSHNPVSLIVHRYPDRCLFLVSDKCAMYCRFCTRKRKFKSPMDVSKEEINLGIEYIKNHPEIRDVLISGGDPFMLKDEEIEYILSCVRAIKHVEIIRIGTRIPCVLPQRITKKLVNILKKYHPLYINVHFNHPKEVTPKATKALTMLADVGIPLGSQTVLLKGVNDNPDTMKELMHKLLISRVRPYYILADDLVYGTEHFRTTLEKGMEIVDSLRGWTSGLAVPQFILDLPGGGGKVSLVANHLERKEGRHFYFRNYKNECFDYPEVED